MRLGDLDNLKEVINDMFMTGEYDCNSVLKAIDNASTVEAYPFEQVQELVKLNQQFAQEIENLKRTQVKVSENTVNCVLTMFGKCSYNKTGCSDCEIKDKIRKALSERPQGEWIPVSERLPEYTGLYLISIYDLVTVANFTGKHFCDRQMDNFVDVFAWQPLPKPYKEGGAE